MIMNTGVNSSFLQSNNILIIMHNFAVRIMRAVLMRLESFISMQIHKTCVAVLCHTIYSNKLPVFTQYAQDVFNILLQTEQVNIVVADLVFERDPLRFPVRIQLS
jgi:hypothetical protein